MAQEQLIAKNNFIELKYTGYANEKIFDSNIEEDLKTLDPKAKIEKTIIAVGQGMVVSGLDKALEGKEIGKEYKISLSSSESFGGRKREFVKTIPLKIFTEQKIFPQAGMVLNLDNMLARIITVSGARVITDFNNPLAGKNISYKFNAVRKVTDEKEKIESLFSFFLKFIPEYNIAEKIIVKGPKILESPVKELSPKFKELLGKELDFKEHEHKEKHSAEHAEDHVHEHEDNHVSEHKDEHVHEEKMGKTLPP